MSKEQFDILITAILLAPLLNSILVGSYNHILIVNSTKRRIKILKSLNVKIEELDKEKETEVIK